MGIPLTLNKDPHLMKDTRDMMHTFIEISLAGDDGDATRDLLEKGFKIFKRYEKRYNFFDPASTLSRLNRSRRPFKASRELFRMLKVCLSISRISHGAFDITVGPLVKLWDFSAPDPRIPEDQEIKRVLKTIGYRTITLTDDRIEKKPGIRIDLSGVVKGFAVDDACDFFIKKGIGQAMVNGGRNIRVIGRTMRQEPWRIGILNPRNQEELMAVLSLEDEAVATSGDYENYFIKNGVWYHHLLDPATGHPVSHCQSATVISRSAALTDMLSTTAFILGPDKGMPVLKAFGCEGVFITKEGILSTPGIGKKLEIL
ncbi:MAG: FAD:protein FMN transferase [Candidatus Eremiobacteraeota bacterium]|nr:FAD:protein FMN transferase [Candidatus Eremiobacteraeota bacterium]